MMIFSTTILLQEPRWLVYCLFAFANLIIRYPSTLWLNDAMEFCGCQWLQIVATQNRILTKILFAADKSKTDGLNRRFCVSFGGAEGS